MIAVVVVAGLILVSCGGNDSSSGNTVAPEVTEQEAAEQEEEDATEPEVPGQVVTDPVASEPENAEPVYAVVECPMPVASDLDVECGTVTVPENRDDPDGGDVELAVARVRSASPDGATLAHELDRRHPRP